VEHTPGSQKKKKGLEAGPSKDLVASDTCREERACYANGKVSKRQDSKVYVMHNCHPLASNIKLVFEQTLW
jgi:hypothetical protein